MARNPLSPRQPLALEGDLDVFSVQQQMERILPLLEAGDGPARLDLSDIRDLDLSGVQLICALGCHLKVQGTELVLSGVQDAWRARFHLLGLGNIFDGGAR